MVQKTVAKLDETGMTENMLKVRIYKVYLVPY